MYDKKVIRRRRAVLGACVVLSLGLLTAYFGEAASGPFHAIQRGVVQVLSPIQEGASRALKPVRDLAGWVSDTFHAKSKADKLAKQNADLRRRLVTAQNAEAENAQLTKLVGLDRTTLDVYQPRTARVTVRSPTIWYATIQIDLGSGDGVHMHDPVVTGDGLVGQVSAVTSSAAVVTLLTDHTSGASVEILEEGHAPDLGLLVPSVGDPGDLLVQALPQGSQARKGDLVQSAGSQSTRLPSYFPKGIPIGTVSRVSQSELTGTDRQVHVTLAADLHHLDFVQVLTRPAPGIRAQAP